MGKQKRMVLFIRIKIYYLILPYKSQKEIVIYNMQKIQNGFFNFEVHHSLHEFTRNPTIFEKFYFYQRKGGPSVIL